ncbi:NAD-dependent epimerase/dehydratase family protein [Hansschlegelia sp. KR7-227]|uniref:NAD-dependent epimerase/dehydratase family protein n=1 Tax=Hansschlegelia sp. KR7-227 TaxID=3400914 RepID=UPI003BFAF185
MVASETSQILVTGAAGFIGAAVARRLADQGFAVRAGVRRSAPPAWLVGRPGVAPIACDLDREAEVAAAVAGAGLVVHAAYGPDADMVPQCRRLLAAMANAGVRDLVHFSSIAVYGERAGRIVETDGPVGALGSYGEAKAGCERLIRDWVAADASAGRRALLLRPGVVYGRGSRFWVDKMADRIQAGAWGDFGAAAGGSAPLVHVDDVAELAAQAVRALTSGGAPGLEGADALNVVGPETPSWRAYFAALAEAIGAPPLRPVGAREIAFRRALSLPAKAWRRLGLPGLRAAALAPTSGEMALFARDATFSTEAAERLLSFRPAIGLRDGLARSVGAGQPKA